jgi:hypothetical protein
MYALAAASTATPPIPTCALIPRYVQYFRCGVGAVTTGRNIARNPSLIPPLFVAWNAPVVTGRSVDVVSEATKISPVWSSAMPPGFWVDSEPLPAKSVE